MNIEDTDLFSGAEKPKMDAVLAGVAAGANENAGTLGFVSAVAETCGFVVAITAGEDTTVGFAAAGMPKLTAGAATELPNMLEGTDDTGL